MSYKNPRIVTSSEATQSYVAGYPAETVMLPECLRCTYYMQQSLSSGNLKDNL